MQSDNPHFNQLVQFLLPKEIFEYFEILKVEEVHSDIHVYLDEQDIKPVKYENDRLTSHGFHESTTIQDFPIRDKSMYLHVRRRRWFDEQSNKVVCRDWDAVAKGTRLTKDFATFLKGLFG